MFPTLTKEIHCLVNMYYAIRGVCLGMLYHVGPIIPNWMLGDEFIWYTSQISKIVPKPDYYGLIILYRYMPHISCDGRMYSRLVSSLEPLH